MPRTLLAIRCWHHVMPWHRSDESTVKQIEEKRKLPKPIVRYCSSMVEEGNWMSRWNVHGLRWCRDELRRFGDATASSNHFSIPPPTSSLNPSSNSHSADSLSILDFTPSSAREAFFAHTDGRMERNEDGKKN